MQGRELHVTFGRDRLRVVLALDSIMSVQFNLVQALDLRAELDAAIDELTRAAATTDPRSGPVDD
jgi:hypothetical protein